MSEAKAATQAEPSMEEILASIRRIISEEGTESETSDAEPPRAEPIDDVLELTDVVEEPTAEPEPTPQFAPAPASAPAPAAASQDDIDAIMNGFSEPEPEPAPEMAFEAAAEIEAEPAPQSPRPAPVLRAVEPAAAMPDLNRLMSDAAADAASAAFAGLAGGRRQHSTAEWPIGAGHTVEDLVREMLRPMLKEWLDANLPGLVDRLVRQEIERVARNADAA